MTVINTNTASISAQYNLNKVQKSMDEAMQALSSGKRITSAADDAAGLSIVTRMESQIRGLNQAMRNAADGQSMVDTAEGAMDEISNMLQRMRELALQAANGTNSQIDRENLDAEVNQLKSEIDRIVGTTTFNNKSLLDGSFGSTLQVGSEGGETIAVEISNMGTGALGTITGAAADNSAVTSATFNGVEAKATETKMTFNSDADYSFNLNFETTDVDGAAVVGGVTLSVTNARVTNGSLQQVLTDLNNAVTALEADSNSGVQGLSSKIKFEVEGNSLVITNLTGGDVTATGTNNGAIATGSGSVTFNSVVGQDNNAGHNLILGANNQDQGFVSDATAAATAATATMTITGGGVGTVEVDDTATLTLAVDGEEDLVLTTAALANDDTAATVAAALETALTNNGSQLYTFDDTNADGTLTITRADGKNFTATLTVSDDDAGGENDIAADAVTSSDGVEQAASNVSLLLNGSDTFTFSVARDGDGAGKLTVTDLPYTSSNGGLQGFASSLNALLQDHFNTTDISAVVDGGTIKIEDEAGTSISIADFVSAGGTTMGVSTSTANNTEGQMDILDGRSFANTATTNGAGSVSQTEVSMKFIGDDRYEFTISDGRATAFFDYRFDSATDSELAMAEAEAKTQLERAGLAGVIKVAKNAGADALEFTNILGGEVKIANFKSETTGISDVYGEYTDSNGDVQQAGFAKWLDDGDGNAANGRSISGIDISNLTGATDAVDIIDAALEDISIQRASLGAISNRLDHTISNLGNIVVNTEAAQSRIQDADFATETSNLTKAQILSQAATAMLAQANASKQSVLSLLQG